MAEHLLATITDLLVAAAHGPPSTSACDLAARLSILDALGCGIAGYDQPIVTRLTTLARATAERGKVADADHILVLGAALHALDFDDINPAMFGHPTTVILPALLVLYKFRQLPLTTLLPAFVAGTDVACILGRYLGTDHYERGFHATATLGAVGAAAATANALSLDSTQTSHAIGLAASGAAGLKSVFGSMAKPLQAGRAAETGYRAALMAQAGITTAPDTLDGPGGFAATHASNPSLDRALDAMAERPFVLSNRLKRFPSCYLTHATIACCLEMARDRSLTRPIEKMELTVDTGARTVCANSDPVTGAALKFSLQGLAALALSGVDLSNPAYFQNWSPDTLDRADLHGRIALRFRDGMGYRVSLSATLQGGGVHEVKDFNLDDLRPQKRDIGSILTKFRTCTARHPALGRRILRTLRLDEAANSADTQVAASREIQNMGAV